MQTEKGYERGVTLCCQLRVKGLRPQALRQTRLLVTTHCAQALGLWAPALSSHWPVMAW